mgnify:CR=1 FL=1
MTQTYFMKLTDAGAAAIAAEQAGGAAVTLSEMAVGDGNGNPVGQPTGSETALVREVFRAGISSLYVNPGDGTIVQAELIIPPASGGFAVREVGVFMGDGTLFAYGNFPDTYKPTAAEGSTRDMVVIAAIKVGTAESVELVIDTSIVGATRQWVLNTITPGYLFPGGTTNQVLAKASNADGDTVWKDPTAAVNIVVDAIRELQTSAEGQTTFTLNTVTTDGVAVYIEGVRIFDFTVVDQVTIQLASGYSAGTEVAFVQNEPNEPLKLRRFVRWHTYFTGQF